MHNIYKKAVYMAIFTAFLFAGFAFGEDLIIIEDTTWQSGTYTYDDVHITNSATLTFNGKITLNAQNLSIDSGSLISADGKGYPTGEGPGAGISNAGGSYGGSGGQGSGGIVGPTYGSALTPEDLGSGDGRNGAGGGAIKLVISDTLTLNGMISANGVAYFKGSGGSGGSVYIITDELTGSGTIRANGGNAPGSTSLDWWRAGGGGGRVAVYYQASTLSGSIVAQGGTGSFANGEDGTAIIIDTANNVAYPGHNFRFQENDSAFNFNRIILDNSITTTEGNVSVTANALLVRNNSSLDLSGASVVAVDSANIEASSSITLNDGVFITVENAVLLNSNSSFTFMGPQSMEVPYFTLNNGSVLVLSGKESLKVDTIDITLGSTIAHLPKGRINLILQDLNIDNTSSISADGKGYPTGEGPGAGISNAGGSYGGKGGQGSGGIVGPTYGFEFAPEDLGSGDGRNGVGGGAIKLVISDALTLNGTISANGVAYFKGSGGSGGSIYIIANTLTGSGPVQANGGDAPGSSSLDWWRAGGGGGRVAIYYQTLTFTGSATAKGGIGSFANGEDGTVVIKPLNSDAPITFFNLVEESATTKAFTEDILIEELVFDSVTVSGDLEGTLNFSDFELVRINSGSFSNKGFFTANWQATLEGLDYSGTYRGVIYPDPKKRKVHLRGELAGELRGIAEATLSESTPESSIYDTYRATWKLNKVGATENVSASIDLEGILSFQFPYTSTPDFYFYQGDFEGLCVGHYNGPLTAVVTYVRLVSEGEYKEEGFSIVSYNTNFGPGEGWFYNNSSDFVECDGLFKGPLLGRVGASLDENRSPEVLSGTIERMDLGVPPASDLKIKVWGPGRVSPGETVNYLVELRNDGVKSGLNVTVIESVPALFNYVSSSAGSTYDDVIHIVRHDFEEIAARSVKYLNLQAEAWWGLGEDLKALFRAGIYPREIANEIFFHNSPEYTERIGVFLYMTENPGTPSTEFSENDRDGLIKDIENGPQESIGDFLDEIELLREIVSDRIQDYERHEDLQWIAEYYKSIHEMLDSVYNQPIDGIGYQNFVQTMELPSGSSLHKVLYEIMIRYAPPDDADIGGGGSKANYSTCTSQITTARDPNAKYGPEGNVTVGEKLDYTVEFENEGEGIAFGVYFTDTLDEDLDDSTLVVGPVKNILDDSVIAPAGTYDPDTRTITWLVGEIGPHEGGYAEISVDIKEAAIDGTEIINFATVYFPSVPEETRTNAVVNIVKTATDTIPPTTQIDINPLANDDGWYNSDIVIILTATDNEEGSGVKEIHYTLSGATQEEQTIQSDTTQIVISNEGTTFLSYYAVDNEGNQESPQASPLTLDKTPPEATISMPVDGCEYILNECILANWSVTDTLSGVLSVAGTNPSGEAIDTAIVGPKTFNVIGTDKAGNAITQTVTYYVRYNYSGILRPINTDGSSIFKLSRVVPVKFQLQNNDGSFISTAQAKLYLAKISDEIVGDEVEAESVGKANTGNLFRYDSANDQYIFNLGTKGLSTGTWQIRIEIDDGSSKYVIISLK